MDIVELQSVAMEDLAMLSKFLVKNSLLEGEDVVISDSLVIYLLGQWRCRLTPWSMEGGKD